MPEGNEKPKIKQAIVVVHGIGEQRPMSTLRGFADAILPEPIKKGVPKFWSKPDSMSELLELRKLTAPSLNDQPPTDLYEFYWAYQAGGTKLRHVTAWARTLFWRSPTTIPRHLQFLWWSSWSLIVGAIVIYFSPIIRGKATQLSANTIIAASMALLLAVVHGFIINYIGDAARYFDSKPENIAFRQRVRTSGIRLLRDLHQRGDYDRIVVVGHSLGSVIAYDVLTHLWQEFYFRDNPRFTADQEALTKVEQIGEALQTGADPAQFRQQQQSLWIEERGLRNKWRVTDLITVGSPLTHAQLLMANSHADLVERQAQRELPKCPPQAEDGHYSFQTPKTGPLRILHHAALFACTRWTNLYFPALLGLFGDAVGGPLAGVFGRGIKDIPVSSSLWHGFKQHTPLIHTCYWEPIDGQENNNARPPSLNALGNALELASLPWIQQAAKKAAGT